MTRLITDMLKRLFHFLLFGARPRDDAPGIIGVQPRPILTNREQIVHSIIHSILNPRHVDLIYCVRFLDLFACADKGMSRSLQRTIGQNHVDFVVCDRATFLPVLVIEVHDTFHRMAAVMQRDEKKRAYLEMAGIPFYVIPETALDARQIKWDVYHVLCRQKENYVNPRVKQTCGWWEMNSHDAPPFASGKR